MRIFIEPRELLLFRTGRPFSAGEHNFAESLFPPTPETLQGAVRALLATQWGAVQQPPLHHPVDIFRQQELKNLIGDVSGYGRLRFTGMTLGRRREDQKIERLFPAPAHILQVTLKDTEKKATQALVFLRPEQREDQWTNCPSEQKALLFPDLSGRETAGKSEAPNGWLTWQNLQIALQNKQLPEKNNYLVPEDKVYRIESRLGISMNTATKTTKEGFLYQMLMIRMQKDYGFIIDLALADEGQSKNDLVPQERPCSIPPELQFLPSEGWLTIGGDQRAARFFRLETPQCAEETVAVSPSSAARLLYFATPAYFMHGWLPEDRSIFPVQPYTAAISRYQSIGGWSLDPQNAGGRGKTMHRCVPAGSVYFFEQPITVTRPLTEYGQEIGYGITYTGDWKE